MEKIITYCYSVKYGVGFFTEDPYNRSGVEGVAPRDIFFEDGKHHNVSEKDIIKIGDFTRDISRYNYFGGGNFEAMCARGKKLYGDDKVIPLEIQPEPQIRAAFVVRDEPEKPVKSAKSAQQTDHRVNCCAGRYSGYESLVCSCGSRGACSHTIAVREYFKDHKKQLQDTYVDSCSGEDGFLFPSGRIEEWLKKYLDMSTGENSVDERIAAVAPVADELSARPVPAYIATVLDYIFCQEDELYYDEDGEIRLLLLAAGFYARPSVAECIASPKNYEPFQELGYYYGKYKNIRASFKRHVKACKDAAKELAADNYTPSDAKKYLLLSRKEYGKLLLYYAEGVKAIHYDDLTVIQEAARGVKIDSTNRTEMVPVITWILRDIDEADYKSDISTETLNALIAALPHDEVIPAVSQLRHTGFGSEHYKSLSIEEQKLLAKSMPANKQTVQYILDKVLEGAEPAEIAEYVLCTVQKAARSAKKEIKPLVTEAVKKLPHNILLREYLDYYVFNEPYFGKAGNIALTEEDITMYCECGFEVIKESDRIVTEYRCRLRETGADDCIVIVRTDNQLMWQRDFLGRFTKDSIMLIRDICLRGNEEEVKKQLEAAQEKLDKERFTLDHREFIQDYEALRKKLQAEKIILTDSFKVKITYLLYESEGDFMLGFKVGNVKDYIVKNAESFLDAFLSKETVSYGKELVLTHDIDNLSEDDREVIQMLTAAGLFGVRQQPYRKCVYLPQETLAAFLEKMKGRTIFYNDEPCTLRLDKKEVRISISSEYELATSIDPDTQHIFMAMDNGYIYDSSEHAIDRLEGDTDRAWITVFCEDNKGVAIKSILSEFKKDIYSGNAEAFDLAPSVTNAFKLSNIKIKAYFDYEDKKILLKEELYKEDKKIKRGDVNIRSDADRLESFDKYIKGLGFEDGAITDEGRIMSFFKMDFSVLKKLANVYLSENISNKCVLTVNRSVVRVRSTPSGIMEAFMEKSEYSEEELEQILAGIRRKKKYIFLDKDRIVDLDSPEAKELGEVVKDLGLTPGALYEKKRISMINAIKAFVHADSCSIDRHLRNMMEEIRNFKDYEVAEPEMQLPLRPYQTEGYRWLSVLSNYGMGGILADDMGLGKTLQIITLIRQDKTKAPSLIVCPKSLVFNWINEFAKFDGQTETMEIYGPAQVREALIRSIDYKKKTVYITSYDSLRNDIAYYTGKFAYCILDEAQFIKNVDAQKSKSVKEIKAAHKFALTGTPIENNVVDLWSIFDFIMPGYFEELGAFRSEYNKDPDYTSKIAKRIGPFVLRRIKENVLQDLPDKYEKIVSTEMTEGQRKIYDAIKKKAKDRLDEGDGAFEILPFITQLRQICVDPGMCFEGDASGSGKLQLLRRLIPEYIAAGHRILIFSQFVKGLNQVEDCLKELGISYYMITGATDAKSRIDMIEDFNSGSGTDVFLVSLKAGGTGLNLTGADTVIHLDPWWNVAAENQATDRAHRIGQTRNVEVIKLISENSIEQRVIELQNMKKDLFDRIISSDERSVTGASLEDIAFILR